ncbi:MAG: proline dehydrogenase family protein [Deltaproteobacteria bacterium]|nr:proline dehydrogenase family protein [Deltaproteobacteria bacterium]
MRVFYHFAKRFIAGESLEEMLPKATALREAHFETILDLLGENVARPEDAAQATDEYLHLLQALHAQGLSCTIAVKLTQLGLDIDQHLAQENLICLAAEAKRLGGFVEVDMEGSAYTRATLEVVTRTHQHIPTVGVALQAMLRRSAGDLTALLAERIRVRLVKGAYKEDREIAYQRREDVCEAFLRLAEMLLRDGAMPAIGTHDEALIGRVKQLAEQYGRSRDDFEFQLLYGVRPSVQQTLRDDGWRVRLYLPYGNAWMPYVMRRLRERKENVWFVVKNMFRH